MWSEEVKKNILVELTVPWEDSCEEALSTRTWSNIAVKVGYVVVFHISISLSYIYVSQERYICGSHMTRFTCRATRQWSYANPKEVLSEESKRESYDKGSLQY